MTDKRHSITRRRTLGLIGGALAAPAYIRDLHAAEVTMRLSHMLPPVSPMHAQVLEPWAKEIGEKSEGRIDVQIFPAMQLGGKPPQLADQVRDGIADIAWTLVVYTPGRFPLSETGSLPFMVTTAENTSVALHKFMEEMGMDEYKGVKPLAFHAHAPGKFHMREKAIEKAADMKGLKIRAPNETFGKALEILGAEPVFFPVTEMAVGLANGVIDGTLLPYEVVPVFKLQELTSVHCAAAPVGRGFYSNTFNVLMNSQVYEGLPDDLRAVVDEHSGVEFARRIGANFDTFEEVGRKLCEEQGNTFVEVPGEEVESWREMVQPVVDDWITTLNDKGIDGAHAVERLNALIDAESA
ncbi:TRAP transporter substrate-binding protein [Chelativorans xinjiangense]|uniref:TRAP transporter substrate-binding protein n=1 Tax=Chelativorans xinjiangense TaxID=2681485 RepID=UPI0013567C71|nr:TRAP transporter substrate-binding protein [Chelativorans xinjiangense]